MGTFKYYDDTAGAWLPILRGPKGDPGDTHVPDPTAEPDGQTLKTASGVLVYAEPSAPASGQYAVNVVAASGATLTLPATHAAHDVTMDQDCTFTFEAPTAGHTFLLKLSGAFTPTFPASVVTDGGVALDYTNPTVYGVTTLDGGTSWIASIVASGLA